MSASRRILVRRQTDVGASGANITLPSFAEGCIVHVEGTQPAYMISGPHDEWDEAAVITKDGVSQSMPVRISKGGVSVGKVYAYHEGRIAITGNAQEVSDGVYLPTGSGTFTSDDVVEVYGTGNETYDGIWVLGNQTNAPGTGVVIPASWDGSLVNSGAWVAILPYGPINVSVVGS